MEIPTGPISAGFAVVTASDGEEARRDCCRRKEEARDYGERLESAEIRSVPARRLVPLPFAPHLIALSTDEQHIAVAYEDSVALYEVATILQSV